MHTYIQQILVFSADITINFLTKVLETNEESYLNLIQLKED